MTSTNSTPEWMNLDFFNKILKNCLKDGQKYDKIIKFTINSAAKQGEHIGGNVLRANIKYNDLENKTNELSMIIKYLKECDNKFDKKYQTDIKVMETELKMYSDIIPKFEEWLRNANDETILGPRLLYHSNSPHKVLVLEDLSKSGYCDFQNEMPNEEIAKYAIDKLAKWHACSYKMNYENNGCLENWDNSVFKINEHENTEVMGGGIKLLIKVLKSLISSENSNDADNLELKEITEMLEKIQDKVYKKCSNLYDFSKNHHTKLNVLNHGDFHIKNLLFKYDNSTNAIQDIQIIDFATCFWSSMVFDLIYILYAVYNSKFRNQNRNEIIYKYFKNFENSLKLIGFNGKIPKFKDLLYDIINLGYLELWLSSTFLPLAYGFSSSDTKNNGNIESFVSHEDARLAMYKIPEFLDDIKILLKLYLNQGFLDESYYDD